MIPRVYIYGCNWHQDIKTWLQEYYGFLMTYILLIYRLNIYCLWPALFAFPEERRVWSGRAKTEARAKNWRNRGWWARAKSAWYQLQNVATDMWAYLPWKYMYNIYSIVQCALAPQQKMWIPIYFYGLGISWSQRNYVKISKKKPWQWRVCLVLNRYSSALYTS